MSDQAVLLTKWSPNWRIILAKGQLDHTLTFWTMPILIFDPVYLLLRHPLVWRFCIFPKGLYRVANLSHESNLTRQIVRLRKFIHWWMWWNFNNELSNLSTYHKNSISSKSQCIELVKMNKNNGIFEKFCC